MLCALDLSERSRAVLYHAVGVAGACGARLTLVHVGSAGDASDSERRLQALYLDTVPYGAPYVTGPDIVATSGEAADAVLRIARERNADLIVTGSRARGALARLLLGSTTTQLLKEADRPVLLVPPGDMEVVSLSPDRVSLHFGAVVAAVDLAEPNETQLRMAAALATLAHQPLMLLSVAAATADEHDVARDLRALAKQADVSISAVIIRKGAVASEIARAAQHEQVGLVVMGLRRAGRGTPGAIASAVLESGRALVLAVPER